MTTSVFVSVIVNEFESDIILPCGTGFPDANSVGGSRLRPLVQIQSLRPEKVRRVSAGLFQLNPSWRTGEIQLRWMKSLRDEIRLRRVKRTDLISSSAKCSISSEGFARRFHRGAPQGPRNELAEFWGKGQCLDFTYYTIFRLNMGCPAPLKIKFKSSPLSIFAPC